MCTTLFGKFLWSHRMTNVLKLNQNGTAIVALTSKNVVSSNSDCHDFDFRGNTHRESQIWIMGHFLCKFKQKKFLLELYNVSKSTAWSIFTFQIYAKWLLRFSDSLRMTNKIDLTLLSQKLLKKKKTDIGCEVN